MTFNHSKTFSKDLLNKYDQPAKDVAVSYVTAAGWEVVESPEAYGDWDLVIKKGDEVKTIEVEVKTSWSRIDFPFVTHHVAHRKAKSKADLFIQVNRLGNAIAVCSMKTVHKSPVVKKDCLLTDGQYTVNEPFFEVPSCRMIYFFKDEKGQWRQRL